MGTGNWVGRKGRERKSEYVGERNGRKLRQDREVDK